jgi:hypothetical protein
MKTNPRVEAVLKLARAGEQAGYTLDEMIAFLDSGFTVETLLCLIEWRLRVQEKIAAVTASNKSAFVM